MINLKSFAALAKPEYLLRPHQIGRRLWREVVHDRAQGEKIVRLPWGLDIAVDAGEAIGWSLYTRALYETAVTEALWRLAKPRDSVVDGGSNIGYMASVLASRVGPRGKVYCFEPHPEVFRGLQRNVKAWQDSQRCGSFLLYQAALGERESMGILRIPDHFADNQGTSWMQADDTREGRSVNVRIVALDDVVPESETLGVVKLDVQGYELTALKGMERLLRERRVRTVVFEEERAYPAATHVFLREMGYENFGLEHRFGGVQCVPGERRHYDPISDPPPNYVATVEPKLTMAQLQKGFWQSFGPAKLLRGWPWVRRSSH
jgi:FkbM family methyltransferase